MGRAAGVIKEDVVSFYGEVLDGAALTTEYRCM